MSDQRLKIAVFIDFDNIEIGVKTTLGRQFDIGAVLEAIKERGEIITKIAYGDWKRAGDYGRAMSQHAVRLVQRVMTPGGDKNGADINLALDALEMAFTHDHINAFVIVGGDSDFITLVEKLKQYDKKVFVVGGRAFSSQVMQKNCTEFIAYENVMSTGGVSPKAGAPPDRARTGRGERGRAAPSASLDQALPLVKRALKVLADREVSPQLGLLKSTLLQLDSSFSERDYGAGTFRDFAEKLEKQGLVTLKHAGRSTMVELADEGETAQRSAEAAPEQERASITHDEDAEEVAAQTNGNLAEGVMLVRTILSEATTPPRWPMYVRQFKQFIRNARPDFDERRFGSILDLMRACQKDGFLRLERDRQGGLRVFSSGPVKSSSVPLGWSTVVGEETLPGLVATPVAEEYAATPPQADEDVEDTRGNVAQPFEVKAKRTRRKAADVVLAVEKPKRARKAAKPASDTAPAGERRSPAKARTPSRRSRPSASTARAEAAADRDGRGGENR
jgi:uncharacterized LabA/DUF88 family protein